MADSTLGAIRTKVRRLTRSPSDSQLRDADIDEYVNTFLLYDLPSQLRLFDLKTTFTWYTQPYIGTYGNSDVPGDIWYNFNNLYITADQPAYAAGYPLFWTQSREQFYNAYPEINTILSIGATGDGVTTAYSGTLSAVPIERGHVVFSSIDALNNGIFLTDYTNGSVPNGTLAGDGFGTIDYVTGAYTLNFFTPPAQNAAINSETVPYTPSRPNAILFFENNFVLRPIPDQVYQVSCEVFIRPTALLQANASPQLEQWWQYIAYGTAKKVFEDRSDLESVNLIMPEFKQQERFVLRRTIVDMTKERVSTIYTEQTGVGSGGFGWNPMGGPF